MTKDLQIPNFEDSLVEFKTEQTNSKKLAKEICAFANLKGGRLFIGINDDGTISGVSKPQDEEQRIMQICSSVIHPSIIPMIYIIKKNEKYILQVEIPIGIQKPYAIKQQTRLVYYIRSGSVSREASREELIRMTQASGLVHYEMTAIPGTDMQNLDMRRVKDYFFRIRQLESKKYDEKFWANLLYNTGYITMNEYTQKKEINLAGALLFGKSPRRMYSGSGITAVCFPGKEVEYNTIGRDSYDLPVPTLYSQEGFPLEKGLIDESLIFAQRFLSGEILEGAARKRVWEIPFEVLRETLINAIVHRDYTIATDIMLKIFSDRVEISSPGKLPNTLTIERLKTGCRFPRNPILIETARDYGYVEHLGMGIPLKIIKGMKDFNKTKPDFIVTDEQFTVVLWK